MKSIIHIEGKWGLKILIRVSCYCRHNKIVFDESIHLYSKYLFTILNNYYFEGIVHCMLCFWSTTYNCMRHLKNIFLLHGFKDCKLITPFA